jgi:hypothetical protein
MKTVVAIIVYNRHENIKRWLDCWKQCDQTDAELVVIQSVDADQPLEVAEMCINEGIKYFARQNEGMDIGAFKEVCQGKIKGFPKFDNLLWITDDTIPMSKDFVSLFTVNLNGLNCYEIASKNAPLHVRTTGFCITKDVAERLQFWDIKTKMDCYDFEHRSKYTLMLQVNAMGYRCNQICPIERSPLWDTGNRAYLNRWDEHESVFGNKDKGKVTVICPVFNTFPQIASAFQAQTYENWEIHFIHDGKGKLNLPKDDRFFFHQTKERKGLWGHPIRAEYLQKLKDNGKYVLITNADNYYTPLFLEKAVNLLHKNPQAVASFCSQMIHNYINYRVMNCTIQRGYVDCGQVLLRSKEAAQVGWNSMDHSADWFFFADIQKKYGSRAFIKFDGCHFIHN